MDKTMKKLLREQKRFAEQVTEFQNKLNSVKLSDSDKKKLQIALDNARKRLAEHQKAMSDLHETIKEEIKNRKK